MSEQKPVHSGRDSNSSTAAFKLSVTVTVPVHKIINSNNLLASFNLNGVRLLPFFNVLNMVKSRAGRGALLSSNLPQLQNLIKRDPIAYKEEFLQQWNHYKSILNIFQANPVEQSEQFQDMITFISQVWAIRIFVLPILIFSQGRTMLSGRDSKLSVRAFKLAAKSLRRTGRRY